MPRTGIITIPLAMLLLATGLFAAEVKARDMFAQPETQRPLSIAVYDVPDLAGADLAVSFDTQFISAKGAFLGDLLTASSHEFLKA
ncbi:MAG: hypothetical protein JW941_11230, partial [Candidatus Coatesbacteria bacterium]|nr:hypothetical protein [Candidatus Coatesbacteria bacterium]